MVTISKVNKDTELAKQLLQFVEDCSWHDVKEHIANMLRSWEFTDWECMFAALDDGDIVGMASIMKEDYYPLPDILYLCDRKRKGTPYKRSAHRPCQQLCEGAGLQKDIYPYRIYRTL